MSQKAKSSRLKKLDFTEFDEDTKTRILDYLNSVEPEHLDISVLDNPAVTAGRKKGNEYAIGKEVAGRIIEYKKDKGILKSLDFLNEIKGLGQDKLRDLAYTASVLTAERFLLSMIAHPTDGTDGIYPGIHLRWMFYQKLGFPPQGFILYRRESDLNNKHCLVFHSLDINELILPYEKFHSDSERLIISSSSGSTLHIDYTNYSDGTSSRALKLENLIRFSFIPGTSRIELMFYLIANELLVVKAYRNNRVVWKKAFKSGISEKKIITIDAFGITHIELKSKQNYLLSICNWICKKDDGWRPVNHRCGFGLPYQVEIPEKNGLIKYAEDPCNLDWAVAACRLEPDMICRFKGKNFEDLKEIIAKMRWDGIKVPAGWGQISLPGQLSGDSKNPDMQISAYDLLLMQSMDPALARVLGLYWLDTNAKDNTHYDYKIEAHWPEDTIVKLKHEVTFDNLEVGQVLYQIFSNEGGDNPNIYFYSVRHLPTVVSCESGFAKVTRGLSFFPRSEQSLFLIFNEPVREVQIFMQQLGPETIMRTFGSSAADYQERRLTEKEGVLAVSGQNIKYVLLVGVDVVIFRIHYDFETIERGKHEFYICGVKKGTPLPLQPPENLQATCLLGGMTDVPDDTKKIDLRYRAGLRWDLFIDEDEGLLANAPVAYHVRRKTPREETVYVTADNPVRVVRHIPSEDEPEFEGWHAPDGTRIKEHQYFTDFVDEKGTYSYSVSSLDLFGRHSEYCDDVPVELKPLMPPPPADVRAKYLDYNTYNANTDTFADPALSDNEQNWLRENKQSAVVVRWKWPPELQTRAPDAQGFHVYCLRRWLNLFTGTVSAVRTVQYEENGVLKDGFELDTNIKVQADALAGERFSQDRMAYRIVKNTGGSASTLTVAAIPDWLDIPEDKARPRAGMSSVIHASRPEQEGGAAKNYKDHLNWGTPIGTKVIVQPSATNYELYIPLDQNFFPDFEEVNGCVEEKVRYAQIGVNTLIEEGEGSVSLPSTIIAVYREQPEEPLITDPQDVNYPDGVALKANAADYYGKSSFIFRWPKPADAGVKYNVYRAMDETLFMVDKKNRINGRNIDYDAFLGGFSGINFNPQDIMHFKAPDPDYSSFTNNMLKALANLPDNVDAFAKLNGAPVRQQDPDDASKLLYRDDTLDGRGTNRYFYRVRPIDEIGNLGSYSKASMPVECPKVTPAKPPNISVVNGNRQITIKWTSNARAQIARYMVYRTDDKLKAKDWRRMEPIRDDIVENFVVDSSNPHKLEFSDTAVEPGKNYYYGLRAKDEDGLVSALSKVYLGIAFDYGQPDEPAWIRAQWIKLDEQELEHVLDDTDQDLILAVALEVSVTRPGVSVIIKRKEEGGNYINRSSWLKPVLTGNIWKIKFHDRDVDPGKSYTYRLKLINKAGLVLDSQVEQNVEAI